MKRIVTASLAVVLASAGGLVGIEAGSTASASSRPIIVGEIMGTTGAYGSTGVAAFNSSKMAVDKINAAGGVLGRKIKILYGNDGASATTAALLFKKFVSEGAVAILGSGDTAPTTVAMADSMKIPSEGLIDDGGASIYPNGPTKPPYPWAWSTSLNGYAVGQALGTYAMSHCPTGLYMLHDTTPYGIGGLTGLQISYTTPLKGNDGISENWSSSSPAAATMDSELAKAKATGADCVEAWLTPQDLATFVNEMHSQGDNFTVLGNDETNSDTTFSSLAGANANGVVSAALKNIVNPTNADKAYNKAYLKRFKIQPTVWGEVMYDSVFILAKAIQQAKSTSPSKLKNALNNIHNYNGLTGNLTFTKMQHTTINGPQFTAVQYSAATSKWTPVK